MNAELAAEFRAIFRGGEEPRPLFRSLQHVEAWHTAFCYAYTPRFAEEVRRDIVDFGNAPIDLIRNGVCQCSQCRRERGQC